MFIGVYTVNVTKKFTKRNLARNRKRTIVTSIGVMLSAALICTVIGMVATFRHSLIEDYKVNQGDYHVQYYDVPADISGLVTDNAHVEQAGILANVGFQYVTDEMRTRFYVNVSGGNDTLFTQMNVQVVDGRLPENDAAPGRRKFSSLFCLAFPRPVRLRFIPRGTPSFVSDKRSGRAEPKRPA